MDRSKCSNASQQSSIKAIKISPCWVYSMTISFLYSKSKEKTQFWMNRHVKNWLKGSFVSSSLSLFFFLHKINCLLSTAFVLWLSSAEDVYFMAVYISRLEGLWMPRNWLHDFNFSLNDIIVGFCWCCRYMLNQTIFISKKIFFFLQYHLARRSVYE